jgi:hypothetical protein
LIAATKMASAFARSSRAVVISRAVTRADGVLARRLADLTTLFFGHKALARPSSRSGIVQDRDALEQR